MKTALFIILILVSVLSGSVAQEIKGRFAIQNLQTGKNLRPYEAISENGNKMVLYPHVAWKCMTWEFIHIQSNIYNLRNLFTGKTFQPSDGGMSGSTLVQQPLSNDTLQCWVFEKANEDSYYIKLKGTTLYLTPSETNTNSVVLLKPKGKNLMQLWRLVTQDPDM